MKYNNYGAYFLQCCHIIHENCYGSSKLLYEFAQSELGCRVLQTQGALVSQGWDRMSKSDSYLMRGEIPYFIGLGAFCLLVYR